MVRLRSGGSSRPCNLSESLLGRNGVRRMIGTSKDKRGDAAFHPFGVAAYSAVLAKFSRILENRSKYLCLS